MRCFNHINSPLNNYCNNKKYMPKLKFSEHPSTHQFVYESSQKMNCNNNQYQIGTYNGKQNSIIDNENKEMNNNTSYNNFIDDNNNII